MSMVRLFKVIGSLPSNLSSNSIYAVRVGQGFDLYISDNTGSIAYKVNSSQGTSSDTNFTLPGAPLPLPPGITDYVVPFSLGSTAQGTLALTANRISWIPFVLSLNISLTELAINVTTAATGSVAIGIYEANANGTPGSRLFASNALDTGATGVKTHTGINLNLNRGVYWFGFFSSGTATVRAIVIASARSLALPSLGTANTTHWFTSGTALPTVAPTSGYTASNGTAVPAIGIRYNIIH